MPEMTCVPVSGLKDHYDLRDVKNVCRRLQWPKEVAGGSTERSGKHVVFPQKQSAQIQVKQH